MNYDVINDKSQIPDLEMEVCQNCYERIRNVEGSVYKSEIEGLTVYFCCPSCLKELMEQL
ncbi:MAG: hypothetical protein ACOCRK_07815 [bacterium]